MEFEIGTLSIILIVGLLALISIGVPMGFASGFMGAVLVSVSYTHLTLPTIRSV